MNNLFTKFTNTITNKITIRATTPFIHSNKTPFASIGINKFHLHTLPPPQTSLCLLFHLFTNAPLDVDFRRVYMLQHEDDDSFENGVLVNPRFETFTLPDKLTYNLLVGSCNGLVLLGEHRNSSSNPIHICNPVTREYLQLPEATGFEHIVSGLGFDDVANEYKVIRMVQYFHIFDIVTEVCTLGSGEWRVLGNNPYPDLPETSQAHITQVFANGALHWLMSEDNSIMAFDVRREEFQAVPLPPHVRLDGVWRSHLRELGGYLCLVEDCVSQVHIWVMKEYGVQGSWTKDWVIPLGVSRSYPDPVYPLKLMKNGGILLHVNSFYNAELIWYHPATKTLRNLGISKGPFKMWDAVTAHAKSCVLLKDIVGKINGNLEVKILEEWQLKSIDKPLPVHG